MAQTPGYLAANQPMQDVSELRLLAGMDAALYQRLLPFVCVQPDDALQVNVNTLRPSQAALLVALFPGDLTLQEAQQLLHNRPRTGWSSVAAFLAQPTLQKNRYHACPSLADGAQRTLYRRFYRGDRQSPLSAAQRPATIGAHVLPSSSGDMDSLWWSMNKINASPQAMLIVRLAAAQAPLHWQLFAPGEPHHEASGRWRLTTPALSRRWLSSTRPGC